MATATQKKYTVGASYTPDTSAYADSTDSNAVALKAYDNQLNAYKAALQSAYESQAAENVNARNKLKSQYDASRSNVYTNARLSAIGNNERLASLGLAGNLYDYARSGTSETNRIAQDIAMRKSLASLNQSENEAYSDYQLALLQAQKEAEANYANKAGDIEASKIPYLTALAEATASSGGGGGGGSYYTTTKKSSSGSGSKSSSSSGSITGEEIYNAANAAAKYSSRDTLKQVTDTSKQSALKTAGASQDAINKSIQMAINQYSANAAANLKKSTSSNSKTSSYKYSSRYVG